MSQSSDEIIRQQESGENIDESDAPEEAPCPRCKGIGAYRMASALIINGQPVTSVWESCDCEEAKKHPEFYGRL